MTKHEMDALVQDGVEWEALERATGANPNDLDYPDDIRERIERMEEENGEELLASIEKFEIIERPGDLRCDSHPDGGCGASPETA